MEKVILITSREFVDGRGSMIPIMEDYISLFFQRDPMDPIKGLAGHLREMDEFWKFFKKADDCLCICGNGENSLLDEYSNSENQLKTRNEHNDLMDNKYLGVASDLFQERGCLTTKGNEIVALIKNEKKQDSQFVPGVYEMSSIGDDVRVFVAEEYPYDKEDRVVFSGLKQMYMNALIEMVMNYVGESEKVDENLKFDWLILSHDADWGQSHESAVFKDSLDEINENYPHLKKIIKAATGDGVAKTQIICFQHDSNSDYYNRISELLSYGDKLYDYFTGLTSNMSSFRKYIERGCCSGLDLTKPYLYVTSVPEYFKIEEIQNKGEGIGVFQYNDSSCNNSLLLEILNEDNNRLILLKLLNQAKEEKKLPLIIKLNLSVFKSLPAFVPGKEIAMRKLEHGLDFCFSFLKSSSIWIRIINVDDSFDMVKEEFNWLKSLRLYDFNSAMEFFEYNVRIQKENYLVESGGHGAHITPMIYSDETEYRDFFIGEKSGIFFKFLKDADENRGYQTDDVALRILLVDDKIGNNCGVYFGDCSGCKGKAETDKVPCKLWIIRELMSGAFIKEKEKSDGFNKRTYWADDVKTYYAEDLIINDVWEWDDAKKTLKLKEDKSKLPENDFLNRDGCVQIIGVSNLESALVLMSCCKFDIILLDYLLGSKSDTNSDRVYSTEMFEFLSYGFNEKVEQPDIVKTLKERNNFNDLQLKEFQNNVKLNRGPLDKYWIIPMTSYNSSFISDLQRKHVQFIDHRWNISQGADPINTPWRFLHKLNGFFDLQLRSSVFRLDTLLLFLKYMCEDCLQLKSKDGEDTVGFYDFQAFMGAEYANFMRRYGNRQMLQRDAAVGLGKDIDSDKSVFATYIWNHFYANTEYRDEIELNRLIQRFLRHASVVHNDRSGQQRLEETFGQLCFFIDTNEKVKKIIKEDNIYNLREFDFHGKMLELKKIMDDVTSHSKKKQQNGNKQR